MNKYDFDKVTERRGSNSMKWDTPQARDTLPMWVADMDFEVLPEIRKALEHRADHAIFGYAFPDESYREAVVKWMHRRHDLDIQPSWIVCTNGVVTALKTAVQAFTEPGDEVAVFTPVYYPFYSSIEDNGRKIRDIPLTLENGQYILTEENLKKLEGVKMLMFCNPHNPVGKVWTEPELKAIGNFCRDHDIIVVSDEIHEDFIRPGVKMVPFWNADPAFRDFSILCTAPSKTFNLAALWTSNILIASETLRKPFEAVLARNGAGNPNIFGIDACRAAYTYGDRWVDELNTYIDGNFRYLKEVLETDMPELTLIEPQGTYLAWVDFRNLGMNAEELEAFMKNKAHLLLDEGILFGQAGAGFERFNVACPRSTLKQALEQLKQALRKRTEEGCKD